MATYIALLNYTDQGIKTIKGASERVIAVRQALENIGGRLHGLSEGTVILTPQITFIGYAGPVQSLRPLVEENVNALRSNGHWLQPR